MKSIKRTTEIVTCENELEVTISREKDSADYSEGRIVTVSAGTFQNIDPALILQLAAVIQQQEGYSNRSIVCADHGCINESDNARVVAPPLEWHQWECPGCQEAKLTAPEVEAANGKELPF